MAIIDFGAAIKDRKYIIIRDDNTTVDIPPQEMQVALPIAQSISYATEKSNAHVVRVYATDNDQWPIVIFFNGMAYDQNLQYMA